MFVGLPHLPDRILQLAIVQLELGSDPDLSPGLPWPVYYSKEGGQPDNSITVYHTQGSSGGRTFDGDTLDHFGLQIRVRGIDQTTASRKTLDIRNAFQTQVNQMKLTVEGVDYILPCIAGIGQPIPIGRDMPNSSRYIVTLNIKCAIRVKGT